MNALYKPNGKKVEVADSSLEYALGLGWTKKDPTVKKETAAQKKKALAAEESEQEESETENENTESDGEEESEES